MAAEGETRKRADELQKASSFQSQMLAQVDPAQAGLRLTADVKRRFEAALAKAGVPEAARMEQTEAFASQWSRINATDAASELLATAEPVARKDSTPGGQTHARPALDEAREGPSRAQAVRRGRSQLARSPRHLGQGTGRGPSGHS
jgi:hypothetical protein